LEKGASRCAKNACIPDGECRSGAVFGGKSPRWYLLHRDRGGALPMGCALKKKKWRRLEKKYFRCKKILLFPAKRAGPLPLQKIQQRIATQWTHGDWAIGNEHQYRYY